MAVSIIGPKFYAWDSDTGAPLAFGKVFTYQAGTNTPKATFQSEDGVTANANPTILNGAGYANIYLDGSYKVVVKDADDVEVWTSDPVTDPSGLQKEWINERAATQVSPTSFSIVGNHTDVYTAGKALQLDDASYLYGYVDSVTYVGGNTVVEVQSDDPLTGSLTRSWTGIAGMNSLPQFLSGSSESLQDAVSKRVIRVTSIAAMEEYSAPVGYVFSLNAGGRSGDFDVISGDFSTELAADTLNGVYVGLSDNPTATSKVAKRRGLNGANITWFGAVSDGGSANTDNMPAIQAALALTDRVIVPDPQDGSFYSVADGVAVIGWRQTVILEGASVIIRLSSLSSDQSPVFWLEDDQSALLGENIRASIRSQSPTPEGVVLIGAENYNVSSKNMFHCRLDSISVQGHQSGGNTSGSATHCVKINAPQYSSETACYFHLLTNIKVDNANHGISLNGLANANFLQNIFGQNLGNLGGVGGSLIHFNGAQENNVHGLFLHSSPNSCAIESSTRTGLAGNPSAVRVPKFNHCYGIIAEPSTGGRPIVVRDPTSGNMFFVGKNSPYGNILPANFFDDNNTIFENGVNNSTGGSFNRVKANDSLELKAETLIEADIYQEAMGRVTVGENATVDLFTVRTGARNGGVLNISVFAKNPSLNNISGIKKQFLVSEYGGTQSVLEIAGGQQNHGGSAVSLTNTLNGDGTVTFSLDSADNGGASTYRISWRANYQVENLNNALVVL